LWDVKRVKDKLYAKTMLRDYKNIREAVRRSGVKTRIIKKTGLPFFTFKQRKRVGLVIGVAAAIITVSYLSTMIWTVSVSGNENISDEQILNVFSSLGVKPGAKRRDINAKEISDEALKIFDGDLSFAVVNLNGSNASVEVRESVPAPKIEDNETPCNIVASEDGVVTKVQLYSGQEEIKAGSAVLKGNLLISGVKTNQDKTESLVHAAGNVYAEVEKNISSDFENSEFCAPSREKIRYALYFFNVKIPLGGVPDYGEKYAVSFLASTDKTVLPMGIIRVRATEYNRDFLLEDESCRELLSAKKYTDLCRSELKNCKIISSDIQKNGSRLSGAYKCEKQIGVESEIFVEKN
jgi:similar to stage IV sporulation protein